VCGNDESLRIEATDYRKFIGHMLSADDAYRLRTQMESFTLRIRQQFLNSARIASLLEESDIIERVWYPGIKSHPSNDIALKVFSDRGYGAIVTFDVAGRDETRKRENRDMFIEKVSDNILLIPSLGDSHTIIMPVEPVWGYKYPEPGMIRLSVGFEETDHLIDIIIKALKSLKY
jgi:cystathionine beta-lyase/cystathionine gamma-synthase